MAWIISILLGIVLYPLSTLLAGYTLSTLWGWFVVPALHVHDLSVHSAYGLLLTSAVFLSGVVTAIVTWCGPNSSSVSINVKNWTHTIAWWVSLGASLFYGWVWQTLNWYN